MNISSVQALHLAFYLRKSSKGEKTPALTRCTQHSTSQIDAEKSPYLTEKLKIWMLPTLALIKNEKVIDYIVGLDDVGGSDDFKQVWAATDLTMPSHVRILHDRISGNHINWHYLRLASMQKVFALRKYGKHHEGR